MKNNQSTSHLSLIESKSHHINHFSGRQLAPLLATGLLLATSSAFAIDVSNVIDILAAIAISVAAIGVALITVKGAMIGVPWVLSMMGRK